MVFGYDRRLKSAIQLCAALRVAHNSCNERFIGFSYLSGSGAVGLSFRSERDGSGALGRGLRDELKYEKSKRNLRSGGCRAVASSDRMGECVGHGHRFCTWNYCQSAPVQGQFAARGSASHDGRLRDGRGDCDSDMVGAGSLGASFDAFTSLDRCSENVRVLTVQKRENCRKCCFGVEADI